MADRHAAQTTKFKSSSTVIKLRTDCKNFEKAVKSLRKDTSSMLNKRENLKSYRFFPGNPIKYKQIHSFFRELVTEKA